MIQSRLPGKVGWSSFSLLKRVYCKVKLGIIPKYEKPRIGCREQEAPGEINAPRKASPVLPECHGRASVLIPVSRGNRRMPRKLECGSCLEARQAAAACPSPDAPPKPPGSPRCCRPPCGKAGPPPRSPPARVLTLLPPSPPPLPSDLASGYALVAFLSRDPTPRRNGLLPAHPSELIPALQVRFLNDCELPDANGCPKAFSLPKSQLGNFNAFFFFFNNKDRQFSFKKRTCQEKPYSKWKGLGILTFGGWSVPSVGRLAGQSLVRVPSGERWPCGQTDQHGTAAEGKRAPRAVSATSSPG